MTELNRDDVLAALVHAYEAVQPPALDDKGRPNRRDRTGCMCTLSPGVVAWLIAELPGDGGENRNAVS